MMIKKRYIFLTAFLFLVLAMPFQNQANAQSAFEDPGTSERRSQDSGDLAAVDKKIDAGAVALGSDSQVVVLFENQSIKPIKTGNISLYPSSNVSSQITSNECETQALLPGTVCAVALSIKGLQPGRFRIEMLMRHDGRTKLISSSITGTVDTASDENREAINDLEVTPKDLNFGSLQDSRPLTRSIILRNVTSRQIIVKSIDIESNERAGYSYISDCDALLSGQACIITVTWAPQQSGPSTGVLAVKHDGPTGIITAILDGEYDPSEASEVGIFPEAVPGRGLLTASQRSVDFGDGIESKSSITVSLVNIGDASLTLGDISLANDESGVKVVNTGCKKGHLLEPVEACPLTLEWEPTREGAIIDDVRIEHDGARGIMVLPVRGEAIAAVNKDSKALVLDNNFIQSVPKLSVDDVDLTEAAPNASVASNIKNSLSSTSVNVSGALDGYKITSLAKNRAVISGPGGSRVVFDNQETVIAGVLWQVKVLGSAIRFSNGPQEVILLFDRSLSSVISGSGSSSSNNSSSSTSSTSSTANSGL